MIDTQCPHCDMAYRLKPELAGRQVKCRACQGTFTVVEPDFDDDGLISVEIPAVPAPARSNPHQGSSPNEYSTPAANLVSPAGRRGTRGPKVDELGFFVDHDDDDAHVGNSPNAAQADPHDEAKLLREAARRGAESLYEPRKPKPKAAGAKTGPTAASVVIRLGLGITGIAVAAGLVYLGVRMISTAGIRAALAGLPYEIQAEFEQSSDTPLGSPAPPQAMIDQSLPVRDLSKHRKLLSDLVAGFDAMANAIARINDNQSAEAERANIDQITEKLQGLQSRVRDEKIFQPNPKEDQILSREFGKQLRASGVKIRDQLRRLQSISSFPLAMSRSIAQVNYGLSQMERQFISKGEMPPAEKYAEIRVAGLKNEAEREYVQEAISELTNPRQYRRKTSSMAATRFAIWPVENLSQLVRSIQFGKVIRATGKEIWVVANPISAEMLAERAAKKEAAIAESRAQAEQAKKDSEAQAAEARRASGEVDIPKDADEITRGLLMTRSSNVFQRRQGLDLLKAAALGTRAGEIFDAVAGLLEDADPFVLRGAIAVVKKCEVPGQLAALHKTMQNRSVRDEIVGYLSQRKSPESVEPLVLAMNQFDNGSFVNALIAYGPSVEEKIIPFLGDSREDVRRGVCEVLAAIGGDATLDAMKKLPPDSSFFVRNAATAAITAIRNRKALTGDTSKEAEPKKYETTGTGRIVISPKRTPPTDSGKTGGPRP